MRKPELAYKEEQNKRNGRIGTIIVHTILLLLFLFVGMTPPFPPPEEQGILINFGQVKAGSGKIQPKKKSTPAPPPPKTTSTPPPAQSTPKPVTAEAAKPKVQPSEVKPVTSTTAKPELLTSKVNDAPKLEEERKRKEEELKKLEEQRLLAEQQQREREERERVEKEQREEEARLAQIEAERQQQEEMVRAEAERKAAEELAKQRAAEEAERRAKEEAERKAREEAERIAREEAERKAAEEAAYNAVNDALKGKGGNNADSDNNSTGEGNSVYQGDQGSKDGDPDASAYGDRSTGLGDDGISYDLSGRSMIRAPQISDNSQKTGVVVIKIKVDKNGNVISAEHQVKGSSTSDYRLVEKAKQASMKAKFNSDPNAKEVQFGTISYNFKVQ